MLNIGVIGIGGMGNVHINNIGRIDFAKVTSLCDISPQAQQKAEEVGAVLFSDIDQMIAESKLDAVCVCTPTFLHYEHIKKVVCHGVNVIAEKPLALSSKQTKELFDLAREKSAYIYVAHVIRFWNEYALLRDIVRDERYGKVLDAEFIRLSACPKWVKGGWLFDKEKSGHIPFDLHIHDLDFIISVFGKPEKYAFTSAGNKNKDYKEHYRFTYTYSDKSVVAQASWYNADIPFRAGYRVYFENAVVEYDGVSMMAYSFDFEPIQLNATEKVKMETGINVPATDAYYNELLHFLECVRSNRPSEIILQEEVISVIEMLEVINETN